ncbi:hypothetical protein FB45DRAFT_926455 [Roridomyces roridus]|uniref:Uncharacterized protein n=1 Tax=Roridomyces roridus TaxID=1738132 RepID=A0AAD7BKD8_9AGAR|nr:hypothetical protein FB45DRAFT_926455 [Roridomyces roridus]
MRSSLARSLPVLVFHLADIFIRGLVFFLFFRHLLVFLVLAFVVARKPGGWTEGGQISVERVDEWSIEKLNPQLSRLFLQLEGLFLLESESLPDIGEFPLELRGAYDVRCCQDAIERVTVNSCQCFLFRLIVIAVINSLLGLVGRSVLLLHIRRVFADHDFGDMYFDNHALMASSLGGSRFALLIAANILRIVSLSFFVFASSTSFSSRGRIKSMSSMICVFSWGLTSGPPARRSWSDPSARSRDLETDSG